jgi:hypothetical protein
LPSLSRFSDHNPDEGKACHHDPSGALEAFCVVRLDICLEGAYIERMEFSRTVTMNRRALAATILSSRPHAYRNDDCTSLLNHAGFIVAAIVTGQLNHEEYCA